MFEGGEVHINTRPLESIPVIILDGEYKNEIGLIVEAAADGMVIDIGRKRIKMKPGELTSVLFYSDIVYAENGAMKPLDRQTVAVNNQALRMEVVMQTQQFAAEQKRKEMGTSTQDIKHGPDPDTIAERVGEIVDQLELEAIDEVESQESAISGIRSKIKKWLSKGEEEEKT